MSAFDGMGGTAFEAFGRHVIRPAVPPEMIGNRLGPAVSGLVRGSYVVLVVLGTYAWWMRPGTPRVPSGTVLEGATA